MSEVQDMLNILHAEYPKVGDAWISSFNVVEPKFVVIGVIGEDVLITQRFFYNCEKIIVPDICNAVSYHNKYNLENLLKSTRWIVMPKKYPNIGLDYRRFKLYGASS